jgi:hypothetical protein
MTIITHHARRLIGIGLATLLLGLGAADAASATHSGPSRASTASTLYATTDLLAQRGRVEASAARSAACQKAENVTAQLHHLQSIQLEQAMEGTWAAVAGIRTRAITIDASAIARLQHESDQASLRCTARMAP